jgi:ferric-dicitrate binding protein FerR (iron transport regulator)
MSGEAHKRAMRKWRQARSKHAEVLSGLERAIAAHPAGGRAIMRRSDPKAVTRVPREPGGNGSNAA